MTPWYEVNNSYVITIVKYAYQFSQLLAKQKIKDNYIKEIFKKLRKW